MEKTRNTEEEKKMGQKWVKEEHKASTSRVNTGFPVNTGKLSPMMQEYCKTKEQYKDCILFYRLGDFYEMFFDDALLVTKELEITLTGKDCGLEERAPMCGVPYHAAETYINRLIERGHKVAICEQVEDPKKAKGLVKREVVRIVTPGTTLDAASLDETKNNYLMSIVSMEEHFGCAIADITTGDCFLTEVDKPQKLLDEINKFVPAEIICNDSFYMSNIDTDDLQNRLGICVFSLDSWYFDDELCRRTLKEHFHVGSLEGLGIGDYDCGIIAAGALFLYLKETQKTALSHMATIRPYAAEKYMLIDSSSRRNLELTETMREKNKKGSLLSVLDKTQTAMGARLLRKWVEQPLLSKEEINQRLDGVEELFRDLFLREEIKEILHSMYDFERIMSRVVYQNANARDLAALKNSVENLPLLKKILSRCKSPYLSTLHDRLDTLENIHALIAQSIVEDPPFSVREGGMIREGFNEELDTYTKAKENGTTWIHQLEEEEREKTGIKNLKVRYNKVFGYYIEVTKSNLELVPEGYIRKQTLANAERFITPELKELEELILGAEDKITTLEYDMFCEIRNAVAAEVERIQYCAYIVSVIDCLQSLAEVAQNRSYVKPLVDDGDVIEIKGGRHPVVEKMMDGQFIPNDTYLDREDTRLAIITGPNMAGKSTYMRQTALIVLMAQIGSFVPAEQAHIGIVDRIFTRVGASDDLSAGQSTFMVEMTEVANILHNATNKSLLILDEIGRGTSTFDGLSIAWAVLEYIADTKQIGAKTLFATHYHELSELEGKLSGVKNYCIAVQEQGEDIIFLRKIQRGGADHSYGVQVARLAGLPNKVIRRSGQILKQLNAADITKKAKQIAVESKEQQEETAQQMDMFHIAETQLADEISKLDVMAMTPIEALQTLFELQKKAKGL